MAVERQFAENPIIVEFLGGPLDGRRDMSRVEPPPSFELPATPEGAVRVNGKTEVAMAVYSLYFRPVYVFQGYRTNPRT